MRRMPKQNINRLKPKLRGRKSKIIVYNFQFVRNILDFIKRMGNNFKNYRCKNSNYVKIWHLANRSCSSWLHTWNMIFHRKTLHLIIVIIFHYIVHIVRNTRKNTNLESKYFSALQYQLFSTECENVLHLQNFTFSLLRLTKMKKYLDDSIVF